MDADKFQRILDRDGDRLQKIKKRFTSYRVLSDGTKKQIITDRDIEWLIDKIERLGGGICQGTCRLIRFKPFGSPTPVLKGVSKYHLCFDRSF